MAEFQGSTSTSLGARLGGEAFSRGEANNNRTKSMTQITSFPRLYNAGHRPSGDRLLNVSTLSIAVARVNRHPSLMDRLDSYRFRRPARTLGLVVLLPLSLILTAGTNRVAGRLLMVHLPSIAWIATAAIPSFLLIASLYVLFGDKRSLSWPRNEIIRQRSVIGLAVAWLLSWLSGSLFWAITTGHWTTYARGWPLISAFLLFGPLGEELLFRGLIYGYARMMWPSSATIAIMISTVAFSLHHISLNSAPLGLATAQLVFTVPMGIVLALLRERTGSLWPGFLVHVATNFPATF